jgi:RimJ/RimL family protein N-acetyltransferase
MIFPILFFIIIFTSSCIFTQEYKEFTSELNNPQMAASLTQIPFSTTTPHMTAHQIGLTDFDDLYSLLSNPEVTATLTRGPFSKEETLQNLEHLMLQWNKQGFGALMFNDLETKKFIGRTSLRYEVIEDKQEVVLIYAVLPEFWNKGYATEMGKCCLNVGFETHNFESIIVFTSLKNLASQRVIDKLGFTYQKNFNYRNHEVRSYRMTKNEYLAIKEKAQINS